MVETKTKKQNKKAPKKAKKTFKKRSLSAPAVFDATEKKIVNFYKKEVAAFKKTRYPYGKSYFWIKLWEKTFELPWKTLKITLRLIWKLSYTAVIFAVVFVVIFGSTPKGLGSSITINVSTKADWGRGTFTNANNDGAQDAIQLEPSGSWTERIVTPAPDTTGNGSSSVMAGNYLYLTRGLSTNSFWRYDTINNQWDVLADLPQPAYNGADLAYKASTGEIFAIFGNYNPKFYKYVIADGDWEELEVLPNYPYQGASIETDGTDIYFTLGSAGQEFYRYYYDEVVEVWRWGMKTATLGALANGGNLVYGNDDYMYLVRGNGVIFDRYKIRGSGEGGWTNMANINVDATNYTITTETKGVYWTDGTIKYLYFLRSGGTSNVLRYQITCNNGSDGTCAGEKNTWSLVKESTYGTPGLGLASYASMAYNSSDGYIYAAQGNSTQNVWKLDPDGTTNQMWSGTKQVQNAAGGIQTVGTGGDLINCNGSLQAIRGNNTTGFYLYNKTDNTWSDGSVTNFYSVNNDVKGTCYNNTVYFPRAGSAIIYTNAGGAWGTLGNNILGNAGEGAGLAYNSCDSRIYALRGWVNGTAGTNNLYYQPAGGGAWLAAANLSITDGGTTINYYPTTGARIVSDGTNLFVMVGGGETTFLRYNTNPEDNNWTRMASTPFSQYYGTDMTYNSTTQKIYALAGYYKDETWEYDIAGNSWRKLPRNQKYSYGRGPYNGASIEFDGETSLFATTGLGLSDMWKYSISSANYPLEGTYESDVINLDYVDSNITFTVNKNTPANTSLAYSYIMSDDGTEWDASYIPFTVDGETGTGTIAPTHHKYLKIKITLGSSGANRLSTPTVYDYSLSYNSQTTPPTNPTTINGSSQKTGGTSISSGLSYAYIHPHFLWSGASNNGAGIAGYYVCFETEVNCDDPETDGVFQTSSIYTSNTSLKTGTYHLKIKAIDNNGNKATGVWDAFTYVYNGVSVPAEEEPLHETISTEAEFDNVNSTLSQVDAFDNGGVGSMRLSSVPGFWNQNRLSVTTGAINSGGELATGRCKITGSNELNDNHCLYTFAGNNSTALYRYEIETDAWLAMAVSPKNVNTGGALTEGPGNTLYAARGAGNVNANAKGFLSYDILTNTWTDLSADSFIFTPRDFTSGSTLLFDGGHYIYSNPGAEDSFYRYDTGTGQWEGRANILFGNPNTSNGQYTNEGSDSVYVDNGSGSSDYIYMVQGNYFPYFSRYQISCNDGSDLTCAGQKNTWTPMAQAPIGFFYSGSLTYDSVTNAIYAIAGNPATSSNARQFFLKYDIETNSWSSLPDAPGDIVGYGGSLVNYDGYIYFTRGGAATNFYRFNIAENSWELPNSGFFGPHIPTGNVSAVNSYLGYGNTTATPLGGTYVSSGDGENIYIVRGSYDNTFGQYNVSTGNFTELARLPIGALTGASLAYDNNEGMIYYVPGAVPTIRTSLNNYFFKYNIATNTWSEVSTATRPDAQVGVGSSMAYDGSRYIYLTAGGASNTRWWRYDTEALNWSANLNNPASTGWAQEAGARIVYRNGIMYSIRGGGNTTNGRYFFSCDVDNPDLTFPRNCWTRSAGTDLPVNIVASAGGSLIDGNDGYLYVVVGNSTNSYYRYNIAVPGWEQVSNMPAQPTTGGSGTYQSNRAWSTSGPGTNSYNDGLYSYVIGSATNGVGFEKTGTYTSETIDLTSVYDWANLTATYTLPNTSTTFLTFETQTSAGLNAAGEIDENEANWVWSAWAMADNDHAIGNNHALTINSPIAQHIRVRINFTSSDQILSPRVDAFTINYYQDLIAPANPELIRSYGALSGVDHVLLENPTGEKWFKYTAPYFEWDAKDTLHGAHDNTGGSGVAGYYVYFGENIIGEPITFQEENYFTAPALNAISDSGKTYYFRIQAVDNAGLPASTILDVFTYKFDRQLPTNPTGLEANPRDYSSVDSFVFTWNDDAADANSGIDKIEWCTDCDPLQHMNDITWNELDEGTITASIPPYQPNTNIFYMRVKDKAGNTSGYISANYYYSGGAASPPQDITAYPSDITNAVNNFTFEWGLPGSYGGDSSKLKYYYSINVWPTPYNTIETTANAAGPGPFATQYGENKFYIVAMNEGGVKTNPSDIDWVNPGIALFYAKTTAPGPPLNLQVFDTSDRETAEYSIALKWSQPTSYDAGNFAGYVISRSEDSINFTEVATTTGSAYVDTGLESKLYYYYVNSKDKTQNYSINTSTVSLTPTGRYTSPPTILSQPKITVKAFEATVTWSTNRVCSSFVEAATSFTTIGKPEQDTFGQVDSVTDHTVNMTGLEAGTKYYYRAKFVDPDGNEGVSEITSVTTLPPPTISEVTISEIQLETAYVSWETNTSAICTLDYGVNSVEESAAGSSHIQKLTELKPVTSYDVQISCIDNDDNSFSSDKYSFTTPQLPIASEISVQNKDNVDLPTITIGYKTNVPTTTLVYFKSSDESSPHTFLTTDKTTDHQAELFGLDPAKEYTLSVTGIDDNGISVTPVEQKITTRTDSRPPQIVTNRAIGKVTSIGNESQANIYVKVETDESTTVKIKYAMGVTTNLEQATSEDTLNTYHMITIPANPGQIYSYQIEANDDARNKTGSEIVTTVVENAKASATEIIAGTFSNRFGWLSNLWKQ